MNLPPSKYNALAGHIIRMTGASGDTADHLINALPEHDYSYLYALILNNKHDEMKSYLKDYLPRKEQV